MKKIKLAAKLFMQSLRVTTSYRIDFILSLCNIALKIVISSLFLYIIFESIPQLSGWGIQELIFLYGFYLIPKGLEGCFTSNLYSLEFLVLSGQLDKYLIKPINPIWNILLEKIDISELFNTFVGILIVATSWGELGLSLNVQNMTVLILFTITSVILYGTIKLIMMSLVFWTKLSMPIAMTVNQMSEMSRYPLAIYPQYIKQILLFIFPFGFVAYYPVAVLLKREHFGGIFVLTLSVMGIFIATACFVWKIGLKKYESAGN